MSQPTLIDLPKQEVAKPQTCRNCRHRERHEMGATIISYCGIRKSNRTQNGKLKIKAKDPACRLFEEKMK
jgi:hypothetical protein